jgi:hypothetical protein
MTLHQSKSFVLPKITGMHTRRGPKRILMSRWLYDYAVGTSHRCGRLLDWGERSYFIVGPSDSGTHMVLEDAGDRRGI